MASNTYKTPDDVKVTATESEPDESGSTVWTIKYPDGEERFCHSTAFADNYKKVT